MNVDNISTWTKLLQDNLNLTDLAKFKKDTRTKLSRLFSYLSDNRLDEITNTFTDLLAKGNFNTIDAESITKITLSDIPTLQRISSGQIDDKNIEFATRNKMFTSFLGNTDFEIKKCEAANYLLAGFSNSSVPVFYSSTIFNDSPQPNKFSDVLEKATKELKTLVRKEGVTRNDVLKAISEKESEREIYKYAYLSILKDGIFHAKNNLESFYAMTEVILKDSSHEMDSKILSSLLKSKTNSNISESLLKTIYINAIDSSMLLSRANYANNLDIKPVESGAILFNSQNGQKLPIEIFYSNHEQIGNFAKNVGLRKDGESVDVYVGLSLVGITEVENLNNNLLPIKTHRYYYNATGFEQLGNIVSNLAKVNEDGNIIYENVNDNMEIKVSTYTLDIDKNIKHLEKLIYGDKFHNQNTKEPYKSQTHIVELLTTALKKIQNVDKITNDLPSKIKGIQKVIEEEVILQKLKQVGEAKKPDFDSIQRMTFLNMNQGFINKFIYKNKENLLESSPYIKTPKHPKFITDKEEAVSLANKAMNSVILDLEKNLKVYSYLQKNHLNNPEEVISKIKEISKESGRTTRYDNISTKEQLKVLKESKALSLETILKTITSVIAAKHTQSIPLNIDKLHLEALKNEYYPLVKNDEYKTRYTNENEVLKLIEKKTDVVFEPILEIKESINKSYKDRLENSKANKKPTYGYDFERPVENKAEEENKKHQVELTKFNFATFEEERFEVRSFDTKKDANKFISEYNKQNKELGLTASIIDDVKEEKNINKDININETKVATKTEDISVSNTQQEEIFLEEIPLEEIKVESTQEKDFSNPFDEPNINDDRGIEITLTDDMNLDNIESEELKNVTEEENNEDNDEVFGIDLSEFDNLDDANIPELDAIEEDNNNIIIDDFSMMHR